MKTGLRPSHFSLKISNRFCLPGSSFIKRAAFRPFSIEKVSPSQKQDDIPQPFFVTVVSPYASQVIKPNAVKGTSIITTRDRSRQQLLVLLATPDALDKSKAEEEIIAGVLRHHFGRFKDAEVSVLVAIVDAIPCLKKYLSSLKTRHSKVRALNNPLGYPGVSFGILDLESAAPDLWSEKNRSTSFSENDGAAPYIAFNFYDPKFPLLGVQVPLANTIFKNGQPSTMYLRKWSSNGVQDERTSFSPGPHKHLVSQTINIHYPASELGDIQSGVAIDSLLRKITKPRAVADVNGNVIRALMNESGTSQPASQELEEAIQELSTKSAYANKRVEVWALVTSKSHAVLEKSSEDTERPKVDIDGCSSIFKVQSGGGGWGEKRGLLSLGSTTDLEGESVALKSEDDSVHSEVYPNLVQPGDLVTFAVLEADQIAKGKPAKWRSAKPKIDEDVKILNGTIQFGCIPTMMDAMPSEAAPPSRKSKSKSEESPPQVQIHSFFGASSSQGLHLNTDIGSKGLGASSPRIKTTIDAPYTTVSVYRTKPRYEVRRFTSMSSDHKLSKSQAVLAPLTAMVKHMDARSQDRYKNALLQNEPADQARRLAGFIDGEGELPFTMAKFPYNKESEEPSRAQLAAKKRQENLRLLWSGSGYFTEGKNLPR